MPHEPARPPMSRTPALPAITVGEHLAALAARGRCGAASADPAFAELALDVARVACGLLALGVERGDRVAIMAPPSRSWTLVQLAAARAGAVLVILDGAWAPADLAATLAGLGPRLLVTTTGGSATVPAAARRPSGTLEHVVVLDAPGTVDDLGWSELLVSGSAMDARLLLQRDALLEPTDCVALELRPGVEAPRILTHRDYLAPHPC